MWRWFKCMCLCAFSLVSHMYIFWGCVFFWCMHMYVSRVGTTHAWWQFVLMFHYHLTDNRAFTGSLHSFNLWHAFISSPHRQKARSICSKILYSRQSELSAQGKKLKSYISSQRLLRYSDAAKGSLLSWFTVWLKIESVLKYAVAVFAFANICVFL